MKILITGAAGFIGFHICRELIKKKTELIGFDNLNKYYSVNLKKDRLKILSREASIQTCQWNFVKGDLDNYEILNSTFKKYKPNVVIHLAAQAGVRFSLEYPLSYANSNLLGFVNILECCRHHSIENFIYASSSSVYGGNLKTPFLETDTVDHPLSLYAATKKSNELMAHSYSHLYGIPSTGLRFFTVYGPWGRPDMAPMIFTKAILSGQPIEVFNNGNISRDFTYVDDIVKIICALIKAPAKSNNSFNRYKPEPNKSWSPHNIYNIGGSRSVPIMDFINILEENLGIKAKKIFKPMQPGDVKITAADTSSIENLTGIKPKTSLSNGIKEFIKWYRHYYKEF